jgi:hypothetical protein
MTRYIYALLDPDTDDVRYIGITGTTPEQRYREHVSSKSKPVTPRDFWMNGLIKQGKKPKLLVLEQNVGINDEAKWIKHYIQQGASLVNSSSMFGNSMIRVSKEVKSKVAAIASEESLRTGSPVSMADIVNAAVEAFIAIREQQDS